MTSLDQKPGPDQKWGAEKPPTGFGWLLFSPSGRISRATYIKTSLLWVAVLGAAIAMMFAHEYDAGLAFAALSLAVLMPLSVISMLMLAVKRYHDMGAPGLLALLMLVPGIGVVVWIVLMVSPSDSGPNAYGGQSDQRG